VIYGQHSLVFAIFSDKFPLFSVIFSDFSLILGQFSIIFSDFQGFLVKFTSQISKKKKNTYWMWPETASSETCDL
jgi:hypothetical protein